MSLTRTSYLAGLPAYVYELPCGHAFRSYSRSAPDDENGVHWFYCRTCREFQGIRHPYIADHETPPLHPSGMRMSDNQLAVRINTAIVKDRIAALYAVHWNAIGIRNMATALGVPRKHVEAVALDLGVYESV